jgi:hypothetical protein
MQLTGEIQFQTTIVTSPAALNQFIIRLFPEGFRHLFPGALLLMIYQYIVLKPIFTILLCSIEFVARLSCMSSLSYSLSFFLYFFLYIFFLLSR